MRRKKQLLMAMLCAFSMMINSAAVVAQSKDKQRKSSVQQSPEVMEDVFLIGEPVQDPAFEIALAGHGQGDVIFTPAAQVEFIHNEFSFGGKVVKGAPYSADAITETIQTLPDGNRIIRNSSSKIYRDSAGRTRREHAMKAVGPWAVSGDAPIMVSINDPVSSVHYNLNSNTKTAHKMAAPFKVFRSGDANMDAELKAKMKDKLKMKAANDAETGVVTGVATGTAGGVVTHTVTGGGASSVSMVAGERVVLRSIASDAEANRESLGKQTIEGVEAEGTRTTFTIPAGKIGNERPIVTVNERWYSPELQTVVLSKNSDPRMGETTYRLTNIVRSEPDPSLFQVPADYTIEENGFGFRPGPPGPLKKRRLNDN
ncbi:MAG: hypothetical protein ACREA2_00560 [Blastocatellia bacterium]